MSIKRTSQRAAQIAVIAPQCPPLGLNEQRFVSEALSDLAPDWSVDLHGFCSDEATLILLPEGGDDSFGPSFLVSRENFGFKLDKLHWDEINEIGLYPTLTDVVDAIRTTLSLSAYPGADSRITLH